ncbi:MAG: GNAT family N-acetyltransferase, partial [Anaerohalosphaeraceae bacterium]|nr:GNAT family N-acetyltransferase [Anaerohalosphaeraceae bacterium]
MSFCVELLSRSHKRDNFDCGEESLNEFIKRYARQNAAKDVSRTYVFLDEDTAGIVGYYTLASGSVSFRTMPKEVGRKLPRYPIPAAHIGRLAIDRGSQGQGLGAVLLADAFKRICKVSEQMGICVVTVQALNVKARSFYEAFGFQSFKDDPLHLYMPLSAVRK